MAVSGRMVRDSKDLSCSEEPAERRLCTYYDVLHGCGLTFKAFEFQSHRARMRRCRPDEGEESRGF